MLGLRSRSLPELHLSKLFRRPRAPAGRARRIAASAVGRAAQEAEVAFLVIRAVADPAGQAIPDWVLGNITEAGDPRYGAILAGLLKNPWDLPALIGLAGNNRKAIAALRRVAGHLGPSFGLE